MTGVVHGLEFGCGGFTDYGNGAVEYRKTGEIMLAFKVNVADITGFTVRKPTRDDKKDLKASGLQQVFVVQGGGTELAAVAVNYGTAEKMEAWFRQHPSFGQRNRANAHPAPASGHPVANESTPGLVEQLAQLGQLRDSGVLTAEEFERAKAKLLG